MSEFDILVSSLNDDITRATEWSQPRLTKAQARTGFVPSVTLSFWLAKLALHHRYAMSDKSTVLLPQVLGGASAAGRA